MYFSKEKYILIYSEITYILKNNHYITLFFPEHPFLKANPFQLWLVCKNWNMNYMFNNGFSQEKILVA